MIKSFRFRSLIRIPVRLSTASFRRFSTSNNNQLTHEEVISKYKNELISLRGTPELIDKLEYISFMHQGIEMNPDLYRLFFPFELDEFQLRGLQSLSHGNNVLLMTPTGSGKTLVGELAIYFALMLRMNVIYTTPLKALSNQKFHDFRRKFGADRVALLTGEVSFNKGASITVMTTEIFRNMIYEQELKDKTQMDFLQNTFMVCFDEFHYMNDRDRGTVWEESLISCPSHIRILALSATIGNPDQIREWIGRIHGPTDLIKSNYRPVPLRYFFSTHQGIYPFFADYDRGPGSPRGLLRLSSKALDSSCDINPILKSRLTQYTKKVLASASKSRSGKGSMKYNQRLIEGFYRAEFAQIVKELQDSQKLPAIFFIFSRVGCQEAAESTMNALRRASLLTIEEKEYVQQALRNFVDINPLLPIEATTARLLLHGIAYHHAGLITQWKSFIEELFLHGKIKVLFATETLAAGMNLPARTTVITSISKKTGPEVDFLSTSQLLQMAGRAGRRGLDEEGTVVIACKQRDTLDDAHRILVSPIEPIVSQMKSSYGFVVRLLSTRTLKECYALIERGFGAFVYHKKLLQKSYKKDRRVFFPILSQFSFRLLRIYYDNILKPLLREQQIFLWKLQEYFRSADQSVPLKDIPLGSLVELKSGDRGLYLGKGFIDMTRNQILLSGRRDIPGQPFLFVNTSIPPEIAGEEQPMSLRKSYFMLSESGDLLCFSRNRVHEILPLDYRNSSISSSDSESSRSVVPVLLGVLQAAWPLIRRWDRVNPFPQRFPELFENFTLPALKGISKPSELMLDEIKRISPGLIEEIKRNKMTSIKQEKKLVRKNQKPAGSTSGGRGDEEVVDVSDQELLETFLYGQHNDHYRAKFLSAQEIDRNETLAAFFRKFSAAKTLATSLIPTRPADQSSGPLNFLPSPSDQAANILNDLKAREPQLLDTQRQFFAHGITRSNQVDAILELFEFIQKNVSNVNLFLEDQKQLAISRALALEQDFLSPSKQQNKSTSSLLMERLQGNASDSFSSFGWKKFLDVIRVLEDYGAIKPVPPSSTAPLEDTPLPATATATPGPAMPSVRDSFQPTTQLVREDRGDNEELSGARKRLDYEISPFGQTIASLNTENDLWVALVVRFLEKHGLKQGFSVDEFAAFIGTMSADSLKMREADYLVEVSEKIKVALLQLAPIFKELNKRQEQASLDFPIVLTVEIGGVIEQWSKGVDWKTLCGMTSLEQGDLCRALKRTIELLRVIASGFNVPDEIVQLAWAALQKITRYPVTDDDTLPLPPSPSSEEAASSENGSAGSAEGGDDRDMDEISSSDDEGEGEGEEEEEEEDVAGLDEEDEDLVDAIHRKQERTKSTSVLTERDLIARRMALLDEMDDSLEGQVDEDEEEGSGDDRDEDSRRRRRQEQHEEVEELEEFEEIDDDEDDFGR